MKFTLPPLPYAFDALEPYLDAETMEIHYTKHHQAYLDKFNAVVGKCEELESKSPEDMLRDLHNLPIEESDKMIIKNQGGGFVNHNIYWQSMGPAREVNQKLVEEINGVFGSVESFKDSFTKMSVSHFASGWGWLVRDKDGKLKAYTLPNQDSPLTLGHEPIFCVDVWEHAYYLKYRNKRQEFVEEWWKALKLL